MTVIQIKLLFYFSTFLFCMIFQVCADLECQADKPDWLKQITNKNLIIDWLVNTNKCKDSQVEYPSYDGWYHNLAKIDLGSSEQPLMRGWAAIRTHESQVQNWTNAWKEAISISSFCNIGNNILLLYFGKQVVNEILDTQDPFCTADYFGTGQTYNRKQINYASSYIDGGTIYGKNRYLIMKHISEEGTVDIDGLFTSETGGAYKNNLNILSLLRIIWLRWHNHIAQRIRIFCSNWSSQRVFNEARKWTVAIQQNIYAYEWLPLWTNKTLSKYVRYDPTTNPEVEKLFQAAVAIPQSVQNMAFPVFHNKLKSPELPLSNVDLSKFLKNLKIVSCGNFSTLESFDSVQQKYDLPDINHARKVFQLKPYFSWNFFLTRNNLSDSMLFSTFTEQKLQNVDALIGGTLESRHRVGELFVRVIHDQFHRIRDGDRFWFENLQNNLFSCEDVVKVNQITFNDVLLSVTDLVPEDLESSIFNVSKSTVQLLKLDVIRTKRLYKNSSKGFFFPSIYFFILPFCLIGGVGIGTIGGVFCFILARKIRKRHIVQKKYSTTRQTLQNDWQVLYPLFPVKVYIGAKEPLRKVVVILKKDIKQISVQTFSGINLRIINFDVATKTAVKVINLSDEPSIIIQFPHNYDLVLKFETDYLRNAFAIDLDVFIANNNMLQKELITNFTWRASKSIIVTKGHRQMWLDMFFRVAFAQAFNIKHSHREMLQVDAFVAKEIIYTELTINEFAEAISMHPDNEFVKKMFALVDKDKNGFISFREFVDSIIIFAEGNQEKKAKLLFDLYDINCTGLIPAKDFSAMIKSFLEIVGGKVQEIDIKKTVGVMLRSAGVANKHDLDFNDFKKIIGDDINNLSYAKLGFKIEQGANNSYLALAKRTIEAMYRKPTDLVTRFQSFSRAVDEKQSQLVRPPAKQTRLQTLLLYFELRSKQLFWMIFLTLLILFVYIWSIHYVTATNKLSGINGYIFVIARGAKFPMVLTYALLFITMSRNMWIQLRGFFNNNYFPFDCMVQIHIYVAYLSAMLTVIHVIGETLIFYEIILTSDDVACLLGDYLMNEETFNIHMMLWTNSVVITGVILSIILVIVCVFAQAYVRRKLCDFFYFTHYLYPVIILLILIHSSRSWTTLTYSVLTGSVVLFTLDLFITQKRRKIGLPVIRAEFFPSNVICLVLRRPKNFQFKVGQWVRLAIPRISRHEFHSVFLSTAPHEPYLRIYVHPSNRWIYQVHSLFEGPGSGFAAAPVRVLMDGPYGASAEHWRLYDVVILVGGGTGIAPYGAVLKDISHALQVKENVHCQKIYFIWVAKTQKHFEWIADLIEEAEDNDPKHYLSCHVFITQFYEKFDIRTILIYICEKHYQRISGRSLFTNLRAVTHFGRPAFPEFFKTVQSLHREAKHIGVFSSGPISLSRAVDDACTYLNLQSDQRFEHHSNKF